MASETRTQLSHDPERRLVHLINSSQFILGFVTYDQAPPSNLWLFAPLLFPRSEGFPWREDTHSGVEKNTHLGD
jgi:hypothetical protein